MRRWSVLVSAVLAGLLGAGPVLADEPSVSPAAVGADGRVRVAVVAPITVPVASPGLLNATQLDRFTGPDGILTQELDNAAGAPVTLAVDPRIIASIRVLGDAAPDSAAEWLARLANAPNESFPLLYADADPVLIGQAGQSADLSPLSFDYAIDPDDFGPAVSPTASPSPSPSPSAPADRPALPQSAADLLAWNWTPVLEHTVWPAADTVVAADLPRLRAADYDTVLLDDTNASGAAGYVSFGNEGAPEDLDGIVADSALSDAASAVADSGTNGAEEGAAGLAASVRSVAGDARGSVRVVTLQRSVSDSLRFLPAALATMESAGATPVGLSEVVNQRPGTSTLIDRSESADRRDAVPEILGAVAADDAFSSAAVEPLDVQAPRRLDLLALLSTGWVDDSSWTGRVRQFLTTSDDLRSAVSLIPAKDAVGVGANPPLPVTVRNELTVPVRVYVMARSQGLSLSIPRDRRRVAVTVQPESTQTVRIPTQSVSNGMVSVQFSLVTTSGVVLGQPSTIALDVQAGWETVGTIIVVVLVLGVFGFGVTRNILRRRGVRRSGSDGVAGG